MRRIWLTSGTVAAAALVCIGCGTSDGLNRAPMTGTVTMDGKPLTRGIVVLMPIEGTKAPQATGAIRADGTYSIETSNRPGAVVGKHKVIVQCREELTVEEQRAMKPPRSLIPPQYAKYTRYEETPLIVEVPPEGTVFDVKIGP